MQERQTLVDGEKKKKFGKETEVLNYLPIEMEKEQHL